MATATKESQEAVVLFAGEVKGRPTIELRVLPDGSNEAYLIPTIGQPASTGVPIEFAGGGEGLPDLPSSEEEDSL